MARSGADAAHGAIIEIRMASVDRPPAYELQHAVDDALLGAVHRSLAEVWSTHEVEPHDRAMVATAIAEVIANVVEHGHAATRVTLRVKVLPDSIEAEVSDDGHALPADVVESAVLPPDPLAESGRGIVVARDAVDELRYERTGDENRWIIVHRRT